MKPRAREEWDLWAGGIYSEVRATQDMLCALVVIGVNARGEKHFPAPAALPELVDQTQQLALQRMRYLIVSEFGWRE